MVLEMSMESLFAVVDAFFVARLGPNAIATVGLTESILTLVYSIAVGLSMSATATVARRIGQRRPRDAAVVAVQVIALGIAFALVTGVLGAMFAPNLLRAMGGSDEVVATGTSYARILLGTNVVIMLLFLQNAIFRGAGDASVAMQSLWLANGVNIVLDPCLIFGLGPFPELGVAGAALATSIGRGTGVAYQLVRLARGTERISLQGCPLRLDLPVAGQLLRISIGGIGQFLVSSASWVALVRIVASFGDVAVAGYTIALRIVVFAFLPSWGLSNAAATLVGQNLGAQRPDRAERSVWLTGWFNMIFLGLVTVVFLTFAHPLVGIFTDQRQVLPIAADCLKIISYGYVFYAWEMVMVQAFNGAGDTTTPTCINFGCFWLFQIPLAYLLAHSLELGPNGVFWAVAIASSISAVVGVIIFSRGRWKTRVV
jgi:putative MATE family efflux protein